MYNLNFAKVSKFGSKYIKKHNHEFYFYFFFKYKLSNQLLISREYIFLSILKMQRYVVRLVWPWTKSFRTSFWRWRGIVPFSILSPTPVSRWKLLVTKYSLRYQSQHKIGTIDTVFKWCLWQLIWENKIREKNASRNEYVELGVS